MSERRNHERLIVLEETVGMILNQRCRVLDVGSGGFSMIYVHPTRWPDSLILNLEFPARDFIISGIKCSTVWENGVHSQQFKQEGLFRRRGLRFTQPYSREVRILLTLVEHWNGKNANLRRKVSSREESASSPCGGE